MRFLLWVDEQPSGTVTFLFTDIESSTSLWENDLTAMAAALARHDGLDLLDRLIAGSAPDEVG